MKVTFKIIHNNGIAVEHTFDERHRKDAIKFYRNLVKQGNIIDWLEVK